MVFQPHGGHLAPRHRLETEPPRGTPAQLRTVSVYAALVEAVGLFRRSPLPAIAVGSVGLLAILVGALAAMLVEAYASTSSGSGGYLVDVLGLSVPQALVQIAAATAAFAFLGAPLLVGMYASAVQSVRQGVPTCRGLLSGFAQYPASFVLGSAAGLATALVGLVPLIGGLAGLLIGVLTWVAMAALGDRRHGVTDALQCAARAVEGRLLPLVVLYLTANLVGLSGIALVGAGLIVSVPVMALMLGVGYRDVMEVVAGEGRLPPNDDA